VNDDVRLVNDDVRLANDDVRPVYDDGRLVYPEHAGADSEADGEGVWIEEGYYLLKGGQVRRLYDTNVIFSHCGRFNPFLAVTSFAFIDSKNHRLASSSVKHLRPHGHRS
jgi:hypothetical protein